MREQSRLKPPPFKYPSPILDALLEGLAQSREAKAEVKGALDGRQQALIKVIGARGVSLAPEQLEKILECRTIEQLDAWIERAATATSAAELLGE